MNVDEMCKLVPTSHILGFGIYQSWSAIFVLNKLLNENLDIKRIVEIGACSGGLSLLFGMIMKQRGGKVITFDIVDPNPLALKMFPLVDVTFIKQDIFSEGSTELVKNFISEDRALIFCDGGLKKKEFNIFSLIAKPKDLLMAHDWLSEIFKEDLSEETLSSCLFYEQEVMDSMRTQILSMEKCANSSAERIQLNRRKMYG